MNYDNPTHRAVLDAEGLQRWVEPQLDGYGALREAAWRQGFFKRGSGEVAPPSMIALPNRCELRAIEDRRQAMPMLALPVEGAAHARRRRRRAEKFPG